MSVPFRSLRAVLWLVIAWLIAALAVGCGDHARLAAGPAPLPTPSPQPSPSRQPLPYGLATPAPIVTPVPKSRFVFAFPPGPEAGLYVYDKPKEDVFYYPGAGKGISAAVIELAPGRYLFSQDGGVHVYDHKTEVNLTMVDPSLTGRFAFAPTTDYANNLYYLSTADAEEAAQGIGELFVLSTTKQATESLDFPFDPLAKPQYLVPANAVGVMQGGITSLSVNGAGDAVVFTTREGNLFLFNPKTSAIVELRTNRDFGAGRASSAGIDFPWGRWVCWEDVELQRIFLLDRWTGLIDTVPFANLAFNATATRFPFFSGFDPWHVFFTAILPDGRAQLSMYDHRSELISQLTLLNTFP